MFHNHTIHNYTNHNHTNRSHASDRSPGRNPAPALFALLLFCLLCVTPCASPLSAFVVEVQKDQVNIRQSAGTAATSLGKADKGAVYGWHGAEDGWSRVTFTENKTGFIRNDLLLGYEEVVVTGSEVRIRKEPSLQGAVLGSTQKGDKLLVSDYQAGWYQIQKAQTTGWIWAQYATLGSPSPSPLPDAAADTQQAQQGQESAVHGGPAVKVGNQAPGGVPLQQANQAQGGVPVQQASQTQGGILALGGLPIFDSVSVSIGAPGGVLSGKVITLDPGHGLYSADGIVDPGALSLTLGLWEKDVNLDVALKTKAILEKLGATVWMTHSGTTQLSLQGRAAVANRNNSHIFVSIHANASENTELNGHSVYFYAPVVDNRLGTQRPLRQALAKHIQSSMVQIAGRPDLGVKESNFVVIRETNCPSVLVETAFLSHAQEEPLLAQGAFRQKLAEAIADGIMKYFSLTP